MTRPFFANVVSGALLCMASATAAAAAQTTIPGGVRQMPAVYRFSIGDVQVTALSDGSVPIDLPKLLRGTSHAEVDAMLSRSFIANPMEVSINAFLVELGDRRVLVDTGAGDLFGPGNGGRLPEALALAGVSPDQITDILLSHIHADHIAPFIGHSPIMNWLGMFGTQGQSYVVGAVELSTAVFLILGAFRPILSALGALMAAATYLITLTFLFTTPGVAEPTAGGFPAISAVPGQFLLKDAVLLAASLVLLLASVRTKSAALPS